MSEIQKVSAQEIFDLVLKLKPPGSQGNSSNDIDSELSSLENLSKRLERRRNLILQLSTFCQSPHGSSSNNPEPEIDVSDISNVYPSLLDRVNDIHKLIHPIIQPLTELARKVKDDNQKLFEAIRAFVEKNKNQLDTAKIPRAFTEVKFEGMM